MTKELIDMQQYALCARQAAADGIVLLRNEGHVLPLSAGTKIALFGRAQFHYYKSGTGSGGMVNTEYVTGVREALLADPRFSITDEPERTYQTWLKDHPFETGKGWAAEPWYQEEMPVSRELAGKAAAQADAAVVIIGRTAGEDKDNSAQPGSWYLTEAEMEMLRAVTSAFDRTVVLLNTGNIIDMNWVGEFRPQAVAYIWQGGQEGGNGVLDVLSGDVSPSGKLPDTIARSIDAYPSTANFGDPVKNYYREDIYVGYRWFETFAEKDVLYPFGFGLSYTEFEISALEMSPAGPTYFRMAARVRNVGDRPGRETIQLYVEPPQGKLGKAMRNLVAFVKTMTLAPGQSACVDLKVSWKSLSSFDDSGVTGNIDAYVLESGDYRFYLGSDVRSAVYAGKFHLDETECVEQLTEALAPPFSFERVMAKKMPAAQTLSPVYETVAPRRGLSQKEKRDRNIPAEISQTGDRGIRLTDVAEGKYSIEDFVAQMSDKDLVTIVRGEGMCSPRVTPGTGGAFGGVSDSLCALGVPTACVSDGPSGIRMDSGAKAFALPIGTMLASTFDPELVEKLYSFEGLELRKNKIDALLGPGMNIHRNPLNGRNFEYYSEDPLLSGEMAASVLKGLHSAGVDGVIKHFVMNNQEFKRHEVMGIVSRRAARELYLRGFEIAVKEGNAHAVMTTYGPVNGLYTSSSYDLIQTILRGEWGFDGVVMTDWWAAGSEEDGVADLKDEAAMIRAGNDLNMVTTEPAENTTGDNSEKALAAGTVMRSEYQRSAIEICRYLMRTPAFARAAGREDEIEKRLREERAARAAEGLGDSANLPKAAVRIQGSEDAEIKSSIIDTSMGASTTIAASFRQEGDFVLELEMRSTGTTAQAQMPLTIFKDNIVNGMITLTGQNTEWKTYRLDLGRCFGTTYLRFYFAQGGIELRSVRLAGRRDS